MAATSLREEYSHRTVRRRLELSRLLGESTSILLRRLAWRTVEVTGNFDRCAWEHCGYRSSWERERLKAHHVGTTGVPAATLNALLAVMELEFGNRPRRVQPDFPTVHTHCGDKVWSCSNLVPFCSLLSRHRETLAKEECQMALAACALLLCIASSRSRLRKWMRT